MIERIADKSTFAAIDPVFVAASSGEHEAFDAALSRAANPPRSNAPLHRAGERDRPEDSSRRPASQRPSDRPERDGNGTDTTPSRDAADSRSTNEDETRLRSDATAQDVQIGDSTAEQGISPALERSDEESRIEDASNTDEELAAEAAAGAAAIDAAVARTRDEGAANEKTEGNNADETATSIHAATDAERAKVAATSGGSAQVHVDRVGEAADTQQTLPNNAALANAATDEILSPTTAADLVGTNGQSPQAAEKAASAAVTVRMDSKERRGTKATAQATLSAAELSARTPLGSDAGSLAAPKLSAGNGLRESKPSGRALAKGNERAAPANGNPPAPAETPSLPASEAPSVASDEHGATAEAPKPQAAAPAPVVAGSAQREPTAPTEGSNPRGVVSRLGHNRNSPALRPGDGSNAEAEIQRVRLVQRVSRAFQTLGENGGEVRLRLSPPSLGSIRLEVTLQSGVMSARIETETAAAKALIVDNLPALRERLSAHDIKVSQFDVEVAADSHRQGQFAQGDASPERRPLGMARSPAPQRGESHPTPTRPHRAQGELDVLI